MTGLALIPLVLTTILEANLSPPADPIDLRLRSRVETAADSGRYEVRETNAAWAPSATAIIVCDMWDAHHCLNAVRRVTEIAPRMNQVLENARSRGVLIVHAPSSCMEPYRDHPGRKRSQQAPRAANLPKDIGDWCRQIPSEEKGKYPIDQTDGGEDDDPAEHESWHQRLAAMGRNPKSPWKSQVDFLKIHDEDAISDSGVEIWNLFEQRGIQNVILLGVHTNMCVLGRPFGLRQMAKNGKNVVLMRDMTDTMYNPERAPFVSHFRGTDLIVEHIEKFVCPTITSDQLLGGTAFTFKADSRPRVVIAISEDEYKTNETLPKFAVELLETQLGLRTTVLHADPNNGHVIPGLTAALDSADLLFVSIRRRALPADDLAAVRSYLASGRPLVGIRTASHAFDARGKGPAGHAEWPMFDPDVLGGNYTGHHGDGPRAKISLAAGNEKHAILAGVESPFHATGSLYKVSPLASSATPLLVGTIPSQPSEPVAWTNSFGKSRVFYTSLGHPDDFKDPQFVRLLANATSWALEKTGTASRATPGGSAATTKPNVLFIAIDDLRDWVRYLGYEQVRTPNLDRLAARGVSFTRSYCAAPVCNPSRTALLSGLRPSTSGVYDNGTDWRSVIGDDIVTLPLHFKRSGYYVAGAGKIYHGAYERDSDWNDYLRARRQPGDAGGPAPARKKAQAKAKSEARAAAKAKAAAQDDAGGVGGIRFRPIDADDESMVDYRSVSYALEQLAKEHDRPFLLACGLHKPHMPWDVPKKYFDMYPIDGIQLPKVDVNDLDDVPPTGVKMAAPRGDHAAILESGRWKDAVQGYLAAITFSDAMIGRLIDGFDSSPHRDNTIIVLWSDHGWHLGEKQHWRKFALWEESTRSPLVWIVPGLTKAGGVCNRTVDFMHIYPTLCELTGVAPPKHLEGPSIRPLLANPAAAWDRPALTTYLHNNHAVRTERWRYIRYDDGGEELYDETADPLEWTNLANRPESAAIKSELDQWLPKVNTPPARGGRVSGE